MGPVVNKTTLSYLEQAIKSQSEFRTITQFELGIDWHKMNKRLAKGDPRTKDIHIYGLASESNEIYHALRKIYPSSPKPRGL